MNDRPMRGPTYVCELATWCLQQNRKLEDDYKLLIELELISDNCSTVYDVADADAPRAIEALKLQALGLL